MSDKARAILTQAREHWQNQSDQARSRRDARNAQTRILIDKRDALNQQVHDLAEQAKQARSERDDLNTRVRAAKQARDARNAETRALQAKTGQAPNATREASRLQARLAQLERQQETTVMPAHKEKALIDMIVATRRRLDEMTAKSAAPTALDEESAKAHAARAAAEQAHAEVKELAERAQQAHQRMVALYKQAEPLRAAADAEQAAFVANKKHADAEHAAFLAAHNNARDIGYLASLITPATRPQIDLVDSQAADLVFERFRRGEAISGDDLRALQKAGRL